MQAASAQMYSQAGGAQPGQGAGFNGGQQAGGAGFNNASQAGNGKKDNENIQDADFEEVK